jgi:hypothetical protein
MKIEKGKFYRTRGGEKVEVLTTERVASHPIVIIHKDGGIEVLRMNGMLHESKVVSDQDIIAEWTDPVEIPWSDYPTWCKWVAMDKDGRWSLFNEKPRLVHGCWYLQTYINVHPDYTPRNFTGDWTESLFERPCE